MNYRKYLIVPIGLLLLGVSAIAMAEDAKSANTEKQARLESEYRHALEQVEQQRVAADASMQKANE